MNTGEQRRTARILAVCAALVALWPASRAHAQRYGVSTYTNAEGLPQAQVLSVFQDSGGYMWFGTYGGVARFDGVEYRIYTAADGLVGNVVAAIAESNGGRMFFGTGEGVTVLDDGRLEELLGPDGESITGVRRIFTDTRRGRWIGTDHGLYRERGGSFVRYTEEEGLPSNSVFAVMRDASGYLWVGTERGLARLAGERFVHITQGLPADVAVHAIATWNGRLWVGTDAGVYQRSLNRFTPVELPPSAGALANTVVDGVATESGLWFATPAGALHFGTGKSRLLTTANGLQNHNIRALVADRENNLWFGTDDGVAKLVPGPFVTYVTRDGLPHDFVRGLAEDEQRRIWIATRGGAAVMSLDGRIERITAEDGLTDDRVFAIAPLPGGDVLLGTPTGLFHRQQGALRRLTTSDGLPDDNVRALLPDGRGGVWIGTASGLARWREGVIETVVTDPELGELSILALEQDAAGDLWLATQGAGLIVYDGTGFSRRGDGLGLEQLNLWSVAADWDGGVWVATNGHGAFRIVGDSVVRMSMAEGLVNDFVWQVVSDRSGNVWFYTNRGLDRWDGSAITHFGLADGLADLEGSANAVLEDYRGNIWFGTGKGLTEYVPALDRPRNVAPLIHMRSVAVEGTPVAMDPSQPLLEVPYARSAITFAYAGLSFHDERAVRYRYRMLGFADEWSSSTTERQVSYAQLPPGRYTFEVQAAGTRSDWSEIPASVALVITPGLLQTTWFRALLAAAFGFAMIAVYLRHNSRARREKEKLETVVALRTEQLARSEARMRAALKNSPTFVFSQDRELRYTWAHNPIMGLSVEEILGRRDEDLLDHDAARILSELKRTVLETGVGFRRELPVCRGDDCRELDVSVEPLRKDGEIAGITGAAWDVTRQRELERQLRQAQKMEVVGQLAGGVAHDFNNLLTGITGYAELGRGRLARDSPAAGDFERVLRCAHRAADLTQQLLAFSRRQPLEQTSVAPSELVEGISALLHRLIGEDIALNVSVDPDLPPFRVDRTQIEQVLANLAVNARDAMPDGGELSIVTSQVRFDRETARRERVTSGEYIRITVSDTGSGMSAETQEHIFEPFFTTKEVGKGTGLGLATAYGIVKQHCGYLRVDSTPGEGTTFEILLPVSSESMESTEPATSRAVPRGSESILLVEDEDVVRDVTERWLEQIGYTVFAAQAPSRAEEIFRRHEGRIDLLLTDVVMPEMSGPELYRRFTAGGNQPSVLFMSGYLDRWQEHPELRDPEAAFIQKPFELDALAQKVRSVLDAARGTRPDFSFVPGKEAR